MTAIRTFNTQYLSYFLFLWAIFIAMVQIYAFNRPTLISPDNNNNDNNNSKQTNINPKSSKLNCNKISPSSFLLEPLPSNSPQFLKTYTKWHAKQRNCLSNPKCKDKPKILLSRCPPNKRCLGLGDRMRGVQFSFWLAVATNRVFFLDWPKDPYSLSTAMVPASIDWTLPSTIQLNDSWPYLDWSKTCKQVNNCTYGFPDLRQMYSYDGNEINFFQDDIEKKLGNTQFLSIYTRLHFQTTVYLSKNKHYKHIFYNHTKDFPSIVNARNKFLQALFKPSEETMKKMNQIGFKKNESYISLHIRTGEGVKETSLDRFNYISKHTSIMANKYTKCLSLLINRTNGSTRIFLASDSTNMKIQMENNLKKLGYDIRMFKDQVVHVGKMHQTNEETRSKQEKLCDSYVGVFADLFMLAGSEYILGNGSHFSSTAGMLNKKKGLVVYEKNDDWRQVCVPSMAFREIVKRKITKAQRRNIL